MLLLCPNCLVRQLASTMAGVLKKTTGLVGLAVEAKPIEKLTTVYTKLLSVLGDMPKEAAYREYTEQIIQERLNVVKSEKSVENIEQRINSGQIEEVIEQAKEELDLAQKMVDWQPWEPLKEEAPPGQWTWP